MFDAAGRVLLIRFVVMRSEGEFVFWLTPGGEIEEGETPAEAARREVREELGLELEMTGPVYMEANRFEHQGEMRDNVDFYFAGRCGADDPRLCGATVEEIAVMREIRWWSGEEIAVAAGNGVRFFPVDLVARVKEHGGSGSVR